ncbi:MAG: lectin-like protein [Phycisphaerae bacterium]
MKRSRVAGGWRSIGWGLLGLLMVGAPALGAVIPLSGVVTDTTTGIQYQLLTKGNWTDSEAAAEGLGGHLAVIRNQEQQDFVFNTFGGYGGVQRILWIGLYDPSQDLSGGTHLENMKWVDGESLTYSKWNGNEPNNANGNEFYVAMYYPNFRDPGSWNDWSNRTADPIGIGFYGVVEYVPEPATVGLVGAGVVGMLARRRRRGMTKD